MNKEDIKRNALGGAITVGVDSGTVTDSFLQAFAACWKFKVQLGKKAGGSS